MGVGGESGAIERARMVPELSLWLLLDELGEPGASIVDHSGGGASGRGEGGREKAEGGAGRSEGILQTF